MTTYTPLVQRLYTQVLQEVIEKFTIMSVILSAVTVSLFSELWALRNMCEHMLALSRYSRHGFPCTHTSVVRSY